MVHLFFGELSMLDILMAVITGLTAIVVVFIAYLMAQRGVARWIPRKSVHMTMGTVIGLTIVSYTNLSGPTLAISVFVIVLFYCWAHRRELLWQLLAAGSRPGENRTSTLFAGLMGLVAFALSFLIFLPRPEIFVAAILSVAWADGLGEVVGRTFGGRFVRHWVQRKSCEGSIAVFVSSMLSIVVALSVYSDLDPLSVMPRIVLIAVSVMVTELFCRGWTDNFFLPLVTSLMMWLLLFPDIRLFGVFTLPLLLDGPCLGASVVCC